MINYRNHSITLWLSVCVWYINITNRTQLHVEDRNNTLLPDVLEGVKSTSFLCVAEASAVVPPGGWSVAGALVLNVSTSHKAGDAGIGEVAISTQGLIVCPSVCEGSLLSKATMSLGFN